MVFGSGRINQLQALRIKKLNRSLVIITVHLVVRNRQVNLLHHKKFL